ncbi:MAG TPA: hypothetical protein VGB17_08610 [Pyrinomonadaceae bacterium]
MSCNQNSKFVPEYFIRANPTCTVFGTTSARLQSLTQKACHFRNDDEERDRFRPATRSLSGPIIKFV